MADEEASESWAMLECVLEREVSWQAARTIRAVVRAIVRAEREEAEAEAARQAARATDLLMQGEALRDQMKLHAILHGAYDHLARPRSQTSEGAVAAATTNDLRDARSPGEDATGIEAEPSAAAAAPLDGTAVMMLTGKTITDEQIRELLAEATDVLTAQHCLVALGRCTYGHDADDGAAEARQHCADIINSRGARS
jgi:hypothetical protein